MTIKIAIIGAGKRAVPVIRTLTALKICEIIGVADEKKTAPGLAVAKKVGIPVSTNCKKLARREDLNVLVVVSASASLVKILKNIVSEKVKILYGSSFHIVESLAHGKEQLENIRSNFNVILEHVTNGILVVDDQSHILSANPMLQEVLGVNHKKIIGKFLQDAVPQEEINAMFKDIARKKNEFLAKTVEIINRQDGTTRVLNGILVKIRDYNDQIIGSVLVLEEITKEKDIDRMKSEFISTTSHELRTPLASIKEAVGLIADGIVGTTSPKQKEILGVAQRNIDRLIVLITALLDFSKIESGKFKLKRLEFDINALVKDVFSRFKSLAKSSDLKLKAQYAKNLETLSGDQSKISQVLSHLISNAVNFTGPGGTIMIKTKVYDQDENFVQVSIHDAGIGINKKDFKRIFHKFSQMDSSMTRQVSGSGMGLPICKQIIELHGGKIWVESQPKKGSVFYFILPR